MSRAVYKAIVCELEKAADAMEAAGRLAQLIKDESAGRSLGYEIGYAAQHLPIQQDDRPGRYRYQVDRVRRWGQTDSQWKWKNRLRRARSNLLGVLSAARASTKRNPLARMKR